MGLDVTYKGQQIAQLAEDGNLTLETAGKYCEGDIELSCHPNVGRYWKPPAEWPDLSSLTLPNNDDENVIYVLYDRSIGYEPVFIATGSNSKFYKGTVQNGEFIGDLIHTGDALTDTLTADYTVYKIVGKDPYLRFGCGMATTYSVTVQSVVWVYGVAPFITEISRPQEWGITFSIHLVSFELYRAKNINQIYADVNLVHLKKFYIGYTSNGDFNGNSLTRAGNGGMFYQPQNDPDTVTIKNIPSLGGFGGKFQYCSNLAFQNVTGSLSAGMFGGVFLQHIEFKDNLIKLGMSYLFNGCAYLEYCDLSHIDFTDNTASSNCFAGCLSLKTLKLNDTWKMPLPLNQCFSLTRAALLEIFDDLPTIEEAQTISLTYGAKNYLLSEADKAIATNKGWTIA